MLAGAGSTLVGSGQLPLTRVKTIAENAEERRFCDLPLFLGAPAAPPSFPIS
jgi:hypothetical protein